MKKKTAGMLLVMFLLLMTTGCSNSSNTIQIGEEDIAVVFEYNTVSVHQVLPAEDAQQVREILNEKQLTDEKPSCTFSNRIAIKYKKSYYCLARDGSAVIEHNGKYASLTENEIKFFHTVFEMYGGVFPCEE